MAGGIGNVWDPSSSGLCCVVNFLGEDIIAVKKDVLLNPSKEVGLEVNAEKTTSVFMSHHQNSGQQNFIICNKSFGNVSEFRYLGTTVTYQNYISE
jgi:hypothetical protein